MRVKFRILEQSQKTKVKKQVIGDIGYMHEGISEKSICCDREKRGQILSQTCVTSYKGGRFEVL